MRSALVLGIALLLSSCSGSDVTRQQEATPSESRSLDPAFDVGQQILIRPDGFTPALLVAIEDQPIVWTNETDRAQSVVSDSGLIRSGRIPPGGTFSYTPDVPISISYFNGHRPRIRAAIQVEPEEPTGDA